VTPQPANLSMFRRDIDNMARRRGVQLGYLYERNGCWMLRWYIYGIGADGKPTQKKSPEYLIGRSKGVGKISKKVAEKFQVEKMAEVNRDLARGPVACMTLRQFYEARFVPDRFPDLEANGQRHYRACWKKIDAAFGDEALPSIRYQDVVEWIQFHAKTKSAQWCTKLRNALHAIYEHADTCGMHTGRNPAKGVKIPKAATASVRTEPYSIDELRTILAHLSTPLWEMFVLGSATSMGGAELAGLRIGHLNLTDKPKRIEGREVAPGFLYCCESLTDRGRTTGKTKNRQRVLPIPEILRIRLEAIIGDRPETDPLFYMARAIQTKGYLAPVRHGNIQSRTLGPLGKKLGIRITWHRLRATNATETARMGLDDDIRRTMMGHGSHEMTERYTRRSEQHRMAADSIAESLAETREQGRVN
jgi:integrase